MILLLSKNGINLLEVTSRTSQRMVDGNRPKRTIAVPGCHTCSTKTISSHENREFRVESFYSGNVRVVNVVKVRKS